MIESRFIRTSDNVFYLRAIDVDTPVIEPEATHHVMVVDRSGSMWGDIEKLKQSIEQAIAVESYTNEDVLTTLISFSTHGDVTLHWSNVPASQVMELSGPYIQELRSIRATALTGISQGLKMALEHINPEQTTGLTLFTDGYANSPSSYSEIQALDAFVAEASQNPRLFMNCIGYRDWCDWPRMQSMSNALSGKTVKADSFKVVLDAMKDTQTLLSGAIRPCTRIPAQADGSMLVALNRTTGQVNSSLGDLSLRGISEDDEISVYAVLRADATYSIPKGVLAVPKDEAYFYGALAIAYTSLQDLRAAKALLFASGNKTLWAEHQAAMTPSTLSAMLDDLGTWSKAGTNDGYEMGRNVRPKFNLFDLARVLDGLPQKSVGIPSDEFYRNYRRRSVKRVSGVREEDGSLTPPAAKLVPREDRIYVRGVAFNTSDASVQLETVQVVDLARTENGELVREVEFVSLDGLRDYKSFTMISSGERNIEVLPLEVYTEQAFNALGEFLIPSEVAKGFTPGMKIRIQLKKFRLEADETPAVDDIFAALKQRTVADINVKLYSAMQDKGAASPFSPEQVEALKALHLSPALYFSPPSTYHYTDKDDAVAKGQIDAFTRYKIMFGTVGILSSGAFRSGNAFLKRRYKVALADGTAEKKPTLQGYLAGDTYTVKPPSPRSKDTEADVLMNPVADAILTAEGPRMTNQEIVDQLVAFKAVQQQANELFQGLVMEIGCTGLLPRELESLATCYEPDAFATKFGVKLKKAEKEGIFYTFPNGLVISILPTTSWYTVTTEEPMAAK